MGYHNMNRYILAAILAIFIPILSMICAYVVIRDVLFIIHIVTSIVTSLR